MYLIKAIIDFLIILLLLRLLIRPNEAYFNQIFSLLYRITDPLLIPSKKITRNEVKAILISVLCLVLLRGLVNISIKPMPYLAGAGISFLSVFQLLFQFYMVVWFVSVLSRDGSGSSLMYMAQRAFLPLYILSSRLRIPKKHSYLFIFLFLIVLYSLLSYVSHSLMIPLTTRSPFSFIHGFGEALIIVFGLFPGFFSIIIIVGALLSWVSPDPYNPIVQAIYGITEPFLSPFRRFVPLLGGLDISPVFALICFQVLGKIGQELVAGLMSIT